MLRILPVTGSPENLSIDLPQVVLNLAMPPIVQSNRTLDGGVSVVIWPNTGAGNQHDLTFIADKQQTETIRRIADHVGVPWLIVAGGQMLRALVLLDRCTYIPNKRKFSVTLKLITLGRQ